MRLNVEQQKLIQGKPNGHFLIKGVAGSGKTTVAVSRIPFLLNHYCFAEDDAILMVTFNKTSVNYIQYIYNKVEEENKMDFSSIFVADKNKVNIVTIDSIIYKYFLSYKKTHKFSLNLILDNNVMYDFMAQSIAEVRKLNPNLNVIDPENMKFLIDEIQWIKASKYTEIEEYQNVDRLGRMGNQIGDGPQKLMKNSPVRKGIFDLMCIYNKRLNDAGFIDFKDVSLLALKQVKEKGTKKYTHIIVDESQDLTRVQLEFLKALHNEKEYSSFMFVADMAQSIYPYSWLVKGRSFTSIGFDMKGKSNVLSKNYRTTTQIAQAAYSLLEKDQNIINDDNFVKPSLIDRQGYYPTCTELKNPKNEAEYIISEVKNILIEKYTYKDIVIVSKNKNQLKVLKEYFDKAKVASMLLEKTDEDFEEEKIKLLTIHSIKGLEFKVVFIIGINEGIIPYLSYPDAEDQSMQETMERKLLYVGMTRANELLYLTSSGKPSRFLEDIDSKYLKLKFKCKLSKFYDVSLKNYNFKKNIIDINSHEEKVRQWIIKELNITYKYPLDLVNVEYKVNNFSKLGPVDVAIKIYSNNDPIPYVLIVVKAPHMNLENGLNQLKSFMSNSNTCQYGIVTNGNEVIIINKDFEVINDIPEFNTAMLPSSLENYKYNDLKHKRQYKFTRDVNEIKQISIPEAGGEGNYEQLNLLPLKIYCEIAAGMPLHMNTQPQGEFYVPNDWVGSGKDHFILKVKGDSMIGADIDNGDLVVLEVRQTAKNREIVAVVTDSESATLKRYMKMGDTILLIPENENYEPIQIKSEEAKILGVVIGVIKKESCGQIL
ncbi:UvrD-helicase domain-containing protein [Clostridium lacusfryxellense]|uniref:UvrD-helicase domain-containing protein n=1 Tax=Clostridium lacusfryxellense TaxID=205328 RepID=UPI001C0D51D9|nr:S24 family peptidase [Clostridium lacusfryxellense]MBU3114437.1 UvrD-helicase domain-containing protein [Clostridium lacusfryxellense]